MISNRGRRNRSVCGGSPRRRCTMLRIRRLLDEDWAAVWSIIAPTVRAGETYALPRQLSETEAREYWTGGDRTAFVAEKNSKIVGTYYIRPNQPGGDSHVANCGYMTEAASIGRESQSKCVNIRWNMLARPDFSPCSSISSSVPTSALFGFGSFLASGSWEGRLRPFGPRPAATLTR